MLQDSKLLVSGTISATDNSLTGQTITGAGSTILSTNTIDLLQNRDMGEGNSLFMRILATVAQVGATSVEVQAVTSDDAALSTNLLVLASTGAVVTASWSLGALQNLVVPPRAFSKGQRYLGARYIIVGTSSAGAFITDFGLEIVDSKKFYPSGFAIK